MRLRAEKRVYIIHMINTRNLRKETRMKTELRPVDDTNLCNIYKNAKE